MDEHNGAEFAFGKPELRAGDTAKDCDADATKQATRHDPRDQSVAKHRADTVRRHVGCSVRARDECGTAIRVDETVHEMIFAFSQISDSRF